MFSDVPAYRDSWSTVWAKSAALLNRSVAIPVMVKSTHEDLEKQIAAINRILSAL
jgi:dTDP-4-amino-4,6-dideoxygalactose transaminase